MLVGHACLSATDGIYWCVMSVGIIDWPISTALSRLCALAQPVIGSTHLVPLPRTMSGRYFYEPNGGLFGFLLHCKALGPSRAA